VKTISLTSDKKTGETISSVSSDIQHHSNIPDETSQKDKNPDSNNISNNYYKKTKIIKIINWITNYMITHKMMHANNGNTTHNRTTYHQNKNLEEIFMEEKEEKQYTPPAAENSNPSKNQLRKNNKNQNKNKKRSYSQVIGTKKSSKNFYLKIKRKNTIYKEPGQDKIKFFWNNFKIMFRNSEKNNSQEILDKPTAHDLLNNRLGFIDFIIKTAMMNWNCKNIEIQHEYLPTKWSKLLQNKYKIHLSFKEPINWKIPNDNTSWQVSPALIRGIAKENDLELPTIDLFASHLNHLTPLYCTKIQTTLPHLVNGIKIMNQWNSPSVKEEIREIRKIIGHNRKPTEIAQINPPFLREIIRPLLNTINVVK